MYNIDTHIFMGILCMYIFVILTLLDGFIFSNDIIVFPLSAVECG